MTPSDNWYVPSWLDDAIALPEFDVIDTRSAQGRLDLRPKRVAAYLTGGRARFGTHRLDADLGVGFVVQQISTGRTWEVREQPGFFPALIAAWEQALLQSGRVPARDKAELIGVNETAQWNWVRLELLPSRPADHYEVRELADAELPSPLHEAVRTDVVNRDAPRPREAGAAYEAGFDAPHPQQILDEGNPWHRRYLEGPVPA